MPRVPRYEHDFQNRDHTRAVSGAGARETAPPATAASGAIPLYDMAAALLADFPDRPPPYDLTLAPGERRGARVPAGPPAPSHVAARDLITDLLCELLADPDVQPARIHDEIRDALPADRFTYPHRVQLPGTAERRRAVGRWLCRNGTDIRPVLIGVLLLQCGLPQDVALLRVLAVLPRLTGLAAQAIGRLGGPAQDLIALAARVPGSMRGGVITALAKIDDPQAAPWLLRHAVGDVPVEPWIARGVAEQIGLATALAHGDPEREVLDQAARLIASMCRDARRTPAILDYAEAADVIDAVVEHAEVLLPSLPTVAALAGVLDALCTGVAAALPWPPGRREQHIRQLIGFVGAQPWAAAVAVAVATQDERAAWAAGVFAREKAAWTDGGCTRTAGDEPIGSAAGRLRLAASAPDPGRAETEAETRVLVDGFPVVAAAFPCGRERPARLVAGLAAQVEPKRVVLAGHHGQPGDLAVVTLIGDPEHVAVCAGKLTVVIAREGGVVVWRDWQGVGEGCHTPPPELRFDASEYDAEITRISTRFPCRGA